MAIISKNKRGSFDYEILERFRAGIVLKGYEVKSIKNGRVSLQGSFVVLRQSEKGKLPEVFLIGATIPPYQPKNTPPDYLPQRSRKLLLKKSEIKTLVGKSKQKGLTMIPLMVYTQKGKIKLEFGIAKGKRKIDKREIIKKRETEKEIKETMGMA